MPESNERLAVLEAVILRNEAHIQKLQEELMSVKSNNSATFTEIKESMIHLRIATENLRDSHSEAVQQINKVGTRLNTLETMLERHMAVCADSKARTEEKISKVDEGWKHEKNRLMAYGSGVILVITVLWNVFESGVKSYLN